MVGSDVKPILGLVAAIDDFGLEVVSIRWCDRAGRGGCLGLWHCGHEEEEAEGGKGCEEGEVHYLLGGDSDEGSQLRTCCRT